LDPYHFKIATYINPPSFENEPTSADVSSNSVWCPRPPSNSFSEVENQQQQLRLNSNLSAPIQYRKQTRFPNEIKFQPQTLYSINQSANEDSIPPNRKRSSLADYPVEEIKGKKILILKSINIIFKISIEMI